MGGITNQVEIRIEEYQVGIGMEGAINHAVVGMGGITNHNGIKVARITFLKKLNRISSFKPTTVNLIAFQIYRIYVGMTIFLQNSTAMCLEYFIII